MATGMIGMDLVNIGAPTAIHAAEPAIVLGHAFGSLGCIDLEGPNGKTTCEARAISNEEEGYSLSSQAVWDKYLDESLYPISSRDFPKTVRKAEPAKPLPDSIKQFITFPAPVRATNSNAWSVIWTKECAEIASSYA